jgi:hypothetical protein
MNLTTQLPPHRTKYVPVVWQDCVWFPPVLVQKRTNPGRHRRPVNWTVQIITDPNVCVGRALSIHQL